MDSVRWGDGEVAVELKTIKKFMHCVTTLLDCGKKENSQWKIMEEKDAYSVLLEGPRIRQGGKKNTLRRLRDKTELDGFFNVSMGSSTTVDEHSAQTEKCLYDTQVFVTVPKDNESGDSIHLG